MKAGIKLVCGVGLNDADYHVYSQCNGKRVKCHFYKTWQNMLERCYGSNIGKLNPTYIGCSVAKEWHLFSNFRAWMVSQGWQGNCLDKDLLLSGNKQYSPDCCVFIPRIINNFIVDVKASAADLPTGVSWFPSRNKFRSCCDNPITKKFEHLGYFENADDAHSAWKKRKHELAFQLANLQSDPRVAAALRARYV